MKSKKITQIEVIAEKDARTFQEKVNHTLSKYSSILDVNTSADESGFSALITYEETIEVPEDIADQFLLKHGRRYVCSDCPYLVPDADARSSTHYCRHHEDRVHMDQIACEWFYSGLEQGTHHVVTAEERKKAVTDALQAAIDLRAEKKRLQNEISTLTSKQHRQELELRTGSPWYIIEWAIPTPEEYKRIEGQALHLREFHLLAPSIKTDITERELIRLAEKTRAACLWKAGLDGLCFDLIGRSE